MAILKKPKTSLAFVFGFFFHCLRLASELKVFSKILISRLGFCSFPNCPSNLVHRSFDSVFLPSSSE